MSQNQVTCQDVSTMMRQDQNSILFLINNGGYTIEVAIHDGPYNVIKNWDYSRIIDAIHNGEGRVWTTKVTFTHSSIELILYIYIQIFLVLFKICPLIFFEVVILYYMPLKPSFIITPLCISS